MTELIHAESATADISSGRPFVVYAAREGIVLQDRRTGVTMRVDEGLDGGGRAMPVPQTD